MSGQFRSGFLCLRNRVRLLSPGFAPFGPDASIDEIAESSMKKLLRPILLTLAGLMACSGHKIARAQTLSISHPDTPSKKVEYFLEKPQGTGPWPTVVFLHGHQDWPRAGGKDFVQWGVLNQYADRGYLAVSISSQDMATLLDQQISAARPLSTLSLR